MSTSPDSTSPSCACGGGPGDCRGSPAAIPEVVTLPLAKLKVGQCGTIQEKRMPEADRDLLRAMGLASNASITLCRQGEPCIVAVSSGAGTHGGAEGAGGRASAGPVGAAGSCRIGLTRELSEKIFVAVRQPA